jgi:hypothetical protein
MEFRSFNTPGLAGPHVVKILHFEQAGDPRWSGEVIVEYFQPHRMVCQPQTVQLEGAGNGGRGCTIRYRLAQPGGRASRPLETIPRTSSSQQMSRPILATGHDPV